MRITLEINTDVDRAQALVALAAFLNGDLRRADELEARLDAVLRAVGLLSDCLFDDLEAAFGPSAERSFPDWAEAEADALIDVLGNLVVLLDQLRAPLQTGSAEFRPTMA